MYTKLSLNSVDVFVRKISELRAKLWNLLTESNLMMTFLLAFCIYTGLSSRWMSQQGDAAGYVDALSASGNYNINFSYGLSFNRGVELFQMNPNQGCIDGFSNTYKDVSFLRVHLYLFAIFSKLFDPRILPIPSWPLLLLSISYAIGITTIFQLIKRHTNFKVAFSYIGLVLIASPLFYESLRGQPYLDRLAFGPIVILLSRLYQKKFQKKRDLAIIIFISLITASISERAALIAGLILIISPIIFVGIKAPREANSKALLVLGVFFILCYFLWSNFYSISAYEGNTDPRNFYPNFLRLIDGDRNFNFQIYLSVIAPFILLSLAKLRYLGLVFLAVFPNLLVDVGGAELSGFSTHYLAFVLPILSITSSIGCVELFRHFGLRGSKNVSAKIILVIALLSLLGLNVYAIKVEPEISHIMKIQTFTGRAFDALGFTNKEVRLSRKFSEGLNSDFIENIEIRFDKVVTTPERFMPTLLVHGHRRVEMFPVGIGVNEYLIIPFLNHDYLEVDYNFNGLIPLEHRKIWSSCIRDILERDYVEKARTSEVIGNYILYKKKS